MNFINSSILYFYYVKYTCISEDTLLCSDHKNDLSLIAFELFVHTFLSTLI